MTSSKLPGQQVSGSDSFDALDALDLSLRPGAELVGLRVLRQLATGNVCQVYQAEDLETGRMVALKLLRPVSVVDRSLVARFVREARAVERIDNRHVVKILRLGECAHGPYYTMEYLDGTALLEVLAATPGGLEMARVLHVALQICEALAAAHAAGVVHRDLKPDNVLLLVDEEGRDLVKVIDFGVAKVAAPLDAVPLASTNPGTIVGSPAYMAPEQIRAKPVDYRTDIYALGVLLYELLSGRRPFEGETVQEVLAGHVWRDPPPLAEGIDPQLAVLTLRCLAKAPADRPRGMVDVARELRRIAAELMPAPSAHDNEPHRVLEPEPESEPDGDDDDDDDTPTVSRAARRPPGASSLRRLTLGLFAVGVLSVLALVLLLARGGCA